MKFVEKKDIAVNNDKIIKDIDNIETEKEEKMLNLIAEIIVKSTLKEYYETCD
ncbi:hypothetical protein IM792_02920 [Mucilaginibacter sp. JRF]|uniref:hypothetical protein n=1 Tax=Mucilaginibacter sp. JRF TaxID=2780088 RepID=UPI00187FEF73|nr:hypothetical protein [Mucilaginibacter sp. JRF]MBE9583388.1 hypothetical protein [Mucilaginibacter sp. JRF]